FIYRGKRFAKLETLYRWEDGSAYQSNARSPHRLSSIHEPYSFVTRQSALFIVFLHRRTRRDAGNI
ncbi:hypothetical protein N8152_01310, partial [bacterium]|nr:hypothetical protein [bacterium]